MLKIFKHLKVYKWTLFGAFLCVAIRCIGELFLPDRLSEIVDKGITPGNMDVIWQTGIQMVLISLVISVANIGASGLLAVTGSGLGKNLRNAVFKKVIKASADQVDSFGTSSLITRTTNDIMQMQHLIIMCRMLFMTPIMGIGSMVFAVIKAKELSWLIVGTVVMLLAVVIIIMRITTPLFNVQQKKIDKLNLVLRESLTGVRVIRAFNKTKSDEKVFNDANKDLTETSLKVTRIMSLMNPLTTIIMNVTIIAVYWFGAQYIEVGILNVGQLVAFVQYIMHVMMSLMFFSMVFASIPRATVSAERINAVLESENDIKEMQRAVETDNSGLEFRNVSFRYKGAENPVLENISFVAKRGQTTAIIGSTGSGKSTLIDLIPRFHDIEDGEILIDGKNITDMSFKELRDKIGIVPQKAVIFSGTIADNIRFGKENATDEEIEEAAKTAIAYDFIMRDKDGFQRVISQGGSNLSGGQKQRISIARALVRKPDIFIFDDSFSALDFKTDARLRKELKSKVKDSVVLVVAQRVNTIMDADTIIVLSNGKIAGMGKHKELYESCPVYKEIVLSQNSEEEVL